MKLEFQLDNFTGPLDFLLQLIDKNKLDISEVSISQIADQFIDYANHLETDDMDMMSEFLLMASTLLDIKCRMLLPKQENEDDIEDPRTELVQRLLEYKMYKSIKGTLNDLSLNAARSYYRKPNLPQAVKDYTPPIDYEELIGNTTLSDLERTFRAVMAKQRYRVDDVRSDFGKIQREEINLQEKNHYIRGYLKEHQQTGFRSLLEKQGSRAEIIATFLIVLEMMKTGKVEAEQDELFGEITLKVSGDLTEPEENGNEEESESLW